MARFVEGSELVLELENLITEAQDEIILISPYIKLHPQIRDLLKITGEDPNVKITVVFGKNENDITESLRIDDFSFLKSLANVEIRYNTRLHAKYYANEKMAILTSLNLLETSQNKNIEVGVVVEKIGWLNFKGRILNDSLDGEAFNFFNDLIEDRTDLMFQREPRPRLDEKKRFRKLDYTHSETTIDKLTELYNVVQDYKFQKGYCIRLGTEIPFDTHKPMSWNGFQEWRKDGADKKSKEKYCHFSGELSNGETSITTPVLKKYYKKTMGSNG
jgi:hypothetical protein